MAKSIQKITPNLWFDSEAEEAANFYVSIFKNSKIGDILRYGESGAKISGKPEGSVLTVNFQIEGAEAFMPHCKAKDVWMCPECFEAA